MLALNPAVMSKLVSVGVAGVQTLPAVLDKFLKNKEFEVDLLKEYVRQSGSTMQELVGAMQEIIKGHNNISVATIKAYETCLSQINNLMSKESDPALKERMLELVCNVLTKIQDEADASRHERILDRGLVTVMISLCIGVFAYAATPSKKK